MKKSVTVVKCFCDLCGKELTEKTNYPLPKGSEYDICTSCAEESIKMRLAAAAKAGRMAMQTIMRVHE